MHALRDQGPQWRGVPQGVITEDRQCTTPQVDVIVVDLREKALPIVVLGPQKGERRHQGAGRHSSHDVEIRSGAGLGPPRENARAVSTPRATTGDDENAVYGRTVSRHPVVLCTTLGALSGLGHPRFGECADRLWTRRLGINQSLLFMGTAFTGEARGLRTMKRRVRGS